MGTTSQKIESNQTFGKRLIQIRKAKGFTQVELGKMIGVSQRIIHHYENKAEYPPAQKLIEIARALNMSIDELLGLSDNDNNAIYQDIKPGLAKKLRLASNLPSHDLKALTTFIDALILKQQVKDENQEKMNEA